MILIVAISGCGFRWQQFLVWEEEKLRSPHRPNATRVSFTIENQNFLLGQLSVSDYKLHSITSRCSGKKPLLLSRRQVDRTPESRENRSCLINWPRLSGDQWVTAIFNAICLEIQGFILGACRILFILVFARLVDSDLLNLFSFL